MKCIAIDDEPIALSIVSRYCERRGGVTLETYSSPHLGMQRVCEWKPDVVFLDIEMNGTSGIELAHRLPPSCCLIFTTAYAQYALDGFEVNAVDFLHKPYFYERFDRAMQKAEQWLRMHDLLCASESAKRQLMLKSEYKNVTLSINTILYIESIDNYINVHLADGTSVLSKIPLRNIEEQLPQNEFIRIHRSFLVARNRITGFTRSEITLSKNGRRLPVGKKYAEEVIRLLIKDK
ncbi:MAG: LytTR family DNA-binding domain-containing protein [Odoribacter sp.]|nr:LytTR family DNA-binding domain-containing protein [Odoribacter sp.]